MTLCSARSIVWLSLIAASTTLHAQDVPNAYQLSDQINEVAKQRQEYRQGSEASEQQVLRQLESDNLTPPDLQFTEKVQEISSAELAKNPALLEKALDAALISSNAEGVRLLLPLYITSPSPQSDLVAFANAFLSHIDGRPDLALQYLATLSPAIAKQLPVIVQKVFALIQNHQERKAIELLQGALDEQPLDEEVRSNLSQLIDYLRSESDAKWDINAYGVREKNINNAPKNRHLGKNITFDAPIVARGIAYNVLVKKTVPLYRGLALAASAGVDGRYLWNVQRYNTFTARTSTSFLWHNYRQEWSLTPFFQRFWYGKKPYSKRFGVRLQTTQRLGNWQFFATLEKGRKAHTTRTWLDGGTMRVTSSVLYRFNPAHYVLAGVDFARENSRDKSETFTRRAARLSWGATWFDTWETNLQLTRSIRVHSKAPSFYSWLRRDNNWGADVSVGNRNWHYQGLIPKLNVSYQNERSNYPHLDVGGAYRVYLSIDKRF